MAYQYIGWQCKHCGELFKTKSIADRHEKACLKNEDGQNCIKCTHSTFRAISTETYKEMLCCDCKESTNKGKICNRIISADCVHYTRMEGVKCST